MSEQSIDGELHSLFDMNEQTIRGLIKCAFTSFQDQFDSRGANERLAIPLQGLETLNLFKVSGAAAKYAAVLQHRQPGASDSNETEAWYVFDSALAPNRMDVFSFDRTEELLLQDQLSALFNRQYEEGGCVPPYDLQSIGNKLKQIRTDREEMVTHDIGPATLASAEQIREATDLLEKAKIVTTHAAQMAILAP